MQAIEAGVDCPARAAIVLDRFQVEASLRRFAEVLDHEGDLVGLATESHHHDGTEIWMTRVSPDRALQHAESFVHGAHRTTNAVSEGHDAVNVGEVLEDGTFFHLPGDKGCYGS